MALIVSAIGARYLVIELKDQTKTSILNEASNDLMERSKGNNVK